MSDALKGWMQAKGLLSNEEMIAMLSTSDDHAEHAQLTKAIAEIASQMPLARTRQLYQLARFLQGQPLSDGEIDEIDDLIWEMKFSATDDQALSSLITATEAEIAEGNTRPMFDGSGEFNERS